MTRQHIRINTEWTVIIGVLLCVVAGYLWVAHLVSYQYFGSELHRAARNGNLKAVQWHLWLGADINDQARDAKIGGKTPLHCAIEYRHKNIAVYLLAQGANPNVTDNQGQTPLHYAIKYNADGELIRQLLERNANANSRDNEGVTPLHLATSTGNTEDIALLVSHGAKADVNDKVQYSRGASR